MTIDAWPTRLLACGGPSTPDPRVLRAMTTPLIGQFDPAFTAIMDEVMDMARRVLLTANARCFPVSALAPGGIEAVLNSVIEPGDRVSVDGSPAYRNAIEDMARRYGATMDDAQPRLTLMPHDGRPLKGSGESITVVDASLTLGGSELRTDAWGIDVVVAGVDVCLGAPPGMTLVSYTDAVENRMQQRQAPPPTSYLDLLQLQAYWSSERLNHHTAPTSLVYGLREALRLVLEEGLENRWRRHARVAAALRAGLEALGIQASGDLVLSVEPDGDGAEVRRQLLDEFGVLIGVSGNAWRIGLLGADARLENCLQVLAALEQVLLSRGQSPWPGAARAAALAAYA